MKHIFTSYKLELVKEKSGKYEIENVISSPKDICMIAKNVLRLDKQSEEVLCVLALDIKNKVVGIFEVSRGTLDYSVVSPREIFKRLILINAHCFVVIHNHPSGNEEPSLDDKEIAKCLNECGDMMKIQQLDFCIVGNKLYSFKENNIL